LRGLTLNSVIVLLLLAGLLLFAPQRYARAFEASAGEAAAILLQFPFYFGVLGLLEAGGLVELLAGRTAGAAQALAAAGLPAQWALDLVVWFSAALSTSRAQRRRAVRAGPIVQASPSRSARCRAR
jgi:short-chain fatty acids transporter